MPKIIYHHENNAREVWITVNDDGTVTRTIENSGVVALKSGVNERSQTLPADKAKEEWGHSSHIDKALAELRTGK